MTLEIKHPAVPCLKALNSVFEISVRKRHDRTFRCFQTYLKLHFLLHTEAIGQYSSSETVPTLHCAVAAYAQLDQLRLLRSV